MPPQLVAEVIRFKISREVWKYSKSRRVVCFIEGSYKNSIVKSHDSKVYNGSAYCIPWNDKLKKVQMNFFFIDDVLTLDIGIGLYVLQEDKEFHSDGRSTDVTLMIYPHGGSVAVGKVLVRFSVQDMFDDEHTTTHSPKKQPSGLEHSFAVPGFRFKRLSKVLHWERLRSINLASIVEHNDSEALLTCLDDVTIGDVTQEDVDPHLFKALQLAQYGAQYLISCRKVMKDREAVLKTALKTFQEEEDILDLKIAKLRARHKALAREARDLDDMTVEYSAALRDLNPKLVNSLYRTYQEKVQEPLRRHENAFYDEALRDAQLQQNEDDSVEGEGMASMGPPAGPRLQLPPRRRHREQEEEGEEEDNVPLTSTGSDMENRNPSSRRNTQKNRNSKSQQQHNGNHGGKGEEAIWERPERRSVEDQVRTEQLRERGITDKKSARRSSSKEWVRDGLQQQQQQQQQLLKPILAQPSAPSSSSSTGSSHSNMIDLGYEKEETIGVGGGSSSSSSSSRGTAAAGDRNDNDTQTPTIIVGTNVLPGKHRFRPSGSTLLDDNENRDENDLSDSANNNNHNKNNREGESLPVASNSTVSTAAASGEGTQPQSQESNLLLQRRDSKGELGISKPATLRSVSVRSVSVASAGTTKASAIAATVASTAASASVNSASDSVEKQVPPDSKVGNAPLPLPSSSIDLPISAVTVAPASTSNSSRGTGTGTGTAFTAGAGTHAEVPVMHSTQQSTTSVMSADSLDPNSSTNKVQTAFSKSAATAGTNSTASASAPMSTPSPLKDQILSFLEAEKQQKGEEGNKGDESVISALKEEEGGGGGGGGGSLHRTYPLPQQHHQQQQRAKPDFQQTAPVVRLDSQPSDGSMLMEDFDSETPPRSSLQNEVTATTSQRADSSQSLPQQQQQQQHPETSITMSESSTENDASPFPRLNKDYNEMMVAGELLQANQHRSASVSIGGGGGGNGGGGTGGTGSGGAVPVGYGGRISSSGAGGFLTRSSSGNRLSSENLTRLGDNAPPPRAVAAAAAGQVEQADLNDSYQSYDNDRFEEEEEDDPFGGSMDLRAHNSMLGLSHVNSTGDLDQSNNEVIDFALPSETQKHNQSHHPSSSRRQQQMEQQEDGAKQDDRAPSTSVHYKASDSKFSLQDPTQPASTFENAAAASKTTSLLRDGANLDGESSGDLLSPLPSFANTGRHRLLGTTTPGGRLTGDERDNDDDVLLGTVNMGSSSTMAHRFTPRGASGDLASSTGTGTGTMMTAAMTEMTATTATGETASTVVSAATPATGRTSAGGSSGSAMHIEEAGDFEGDALSKTAAGGGGSDALRVSAGGLSMVSEPNPSSTAGGADGADDEDSSIPPPSYEALVNKSRNNSGEATGGGGANLRASDTSHLTQSSLGSGREGEEDAAAGMAGGVTSTTAGGAGAGAGAVPLTAGTAAASSSSPQTPSSQTASAPPWRSGRASVEQLELASALDVFVSAARLDAPYAKQHPQIQVSLEFLGMTSASSNAVNVGASATVQPVGFSTHMKFASSEELITLENEIADLDDQLSFQVHLMDALSGRPVGMANVELWVMIEDSVNILRQEVEVLNLDMSEEIGSVLVDVKGFRLLKKCAAANRSRWNR